MLNIEKFENLINNANNILLTAHIYPDADAICSTQIFRTILNKQFDKTCDICIADKINGTLTPFAKNVIEYKDLYKKYDLIVTLDCANLSRIGEVKKIFTSTKKTINIDHHISNTNFADLNMVDANVSSTCELLYNMCLQYYPDVIDLQMANQSYAGIITDTNGLMANNIKSSTFYAISDIIKRGVNIDIIKNYFFKSYSKAKLQILGKALNSISFYNSNKLAVVYISNQDFTEYNATFNDTLGVVDYTLNCYLTEIAVAIIEQGDNKYYVSLRSKKSDVSLVANKFNGGGHSNVAAFQYEGELNDLIEKLVKECAKAQSNATE